MQICELTTPVCMLRVFGVTGVASNVQGMDFASPSKAKYVCVTVDGNQQMQPPVYSATSQTEVHLQGVEARTPMREN